MSLKITTHLNVDFYDKKYIMINAKQHDSQSRWIAVTCYDQGRIFNINEVEHSVYINYQRPDETNIFDFCKINNEGEILIELTEQMLAIEGIGKAELVIINKGNAMVNINTGEIIGIDNTSILSTMVFYVNVYEALVDDTTFKDVYEYNAFNDLLQKAESNYQDVIRLSKSYAIGNAGGIRENEDTDNAKYYYENAKNSAEKASDSEMNAKDSAKKASDSEMNAESYMNYAKSYAVGDTGIREDEDADNAKYYYEQSSNNANQSVASEANAELYMNNAESYYLKSKRYAVGNTNTEENEDVDNAKYYCELSKSYAIGKSNLRENEDVDNARYYYEQLKGISDDLDSIFHPMGTITFAELSNAEKEVGYLYNISDDFITDDTFKGGSGNSFSAGTNVYYTADGYWDCLSGADSPSVLVSDIATVEEVKAELGII